MTLSSAVRDGVLVIRLAAGSLDASNAGAAKATIVPMVRGQARVVIDFTDVTFVDSSGLGAMLSCLIQMQKSGGDMKLCGIRKSVAVLFELVRMNRVFDIRDGVDAAVLAFATGEGGPAA